MHAGDKVLEIGANIGRSGIVAAHCAAPGGSVVSSEADPSQLQRAQAEHAREWEGRRQEVRLTPTLTLPLT